jgi:lysophospholipase L1-like esterase
MPRARWRWVAVAAAVVFLVAAGVTGIVVVTRSHSGSASIPLPTSMASVGDSITRAFDVTGEHPLQDTPAESWSTGTDPAVQSQYDRLVAARPALAGRVFNEARTGAQMAALDGQLQAAAAQRVDYVTVLMGANDLCTRTVDAMTPTATFAAEFDRALSGFFGADPGGRMFVASIPDLYQLWAALGANPVAQLTWSAAHVCQSMLSEAATPAERQQVVVQEQADNAVLASVCLRYPHCRFDGGAVYRTQFTALNVSTVDYFHPNLSGQQILAQVTWAAGYWPSTP